MGTWSGEPYGNDEAADWAWELEEATDWELVHDAFDDLEDAEEGDDAAAVIAIAAAEAVAHGLGRPTQVDPYTEEVVAFAARVEAPDAELVARALGALQTAAHPDGDLAQAWAESDAAEWTAANERLAAALRG